MLAIPQDAVATAVSPSPSPQSVGERRWAQMKKKALQLFICAVIVLYIFFVKAR